MIAIAADALNGYRADVAAGKDALLICDTKDVCDALNRRIHGDTITADAPIVTAARGHRVAVGDVILSRRNEPAIPVHDATDFAQTADPVRNGQRWRVYAVTIASPPGGSPTAPGSLSPVTISKRMSPMGMRSPCTRPKG